MRLLYSPTCFEHYSAHHQEVKIVLYSIWYHHTVHRLREDCSPLSTCAPDDHLRSVMIPGAVYYNFDLLMMSTIVLKTCRGI